MVVAHLVVYGFGEQIAWGGWSFEHMPSPNDLIALTDDVARTHTLKVRHVEHFPIKIDDQNGAEGKTVIVCDWVDCI